MEKNSVPRPGDVIFVDTGGVQNLASCAAQTTLDPDACAARWGFSHVAIALSDILALEAMPGTPIPDGEADEDLLPGTVAFGPWTGSELRGGVRLVPIPDLVFPALAPDKRLKVLRNLDVDADTISELNPQNRRVLQILGSEYSIEALRDQAAELIPNWAPQRSIRRFLSSNLNWSSLPSDISSQLNLDAALRAEIESLLDGYALPELARTFFCSQLVVYCLRFANLVPDNLGNELTTPTGLFNLLVGEKWVDVTVLYECDLDAERYLDMTPAGHSRSYTTNLALALLSIKQQKHDLELAIIRSPVARAEVFTRRLIDALVRRIEPDS